jgi:hypothetical protein
MAKDKPVPAFASDAEERAFWETADSAERLDWSHAARVRLPNLQPSKVAISLHLPVSLLEQNEIPANKLDLP